MFLQSFIREFLKAKRTRGYVVIEDETAEKHEFNNIMFASALVRPYGSGLSDCKKDADERIEFCVVSTRHKLRLLRVIWAIVSGRSTKLDGVHIYRGKAMDIVLDQPLPAHVDGEYVGMQDRFTLRSVPRRLRVSI
jgi:diacylglycerol kinase family enzyme